MHELSIAKEILDIVKEKLAQVDFKKILKIEVEIGKLSGIEIDSLKFGLESLVKDTEFEKTEIIFQRTKAEGSCKICNNKFEVKDAFSFCPFCKSIDIQVISGKEMRVREIEVE